MNAPVKTATRLAMLDFRDAAAVAQVEAFVKPLVDAVHALS